MNWRPITAVDLRTVWRSNAIRALIGGVVLVFGLQTVVFAIDPPQVPQGTVGTAEFVGDLGTTLVILASLLAVVVTHRAIAGDVESGRSKLFLTSPHTRHDLVFGKAVSRGLTTLLPVIAGLCLAAALASLLGIPIAVDSIALFILLSSLFTLSFVGATLGLSLLAETELEAIVGGIGLFLAFGVAWSITTTVVKTLWEAVTDGGSPEHTPDWYVLLDILGPAGAYDRLVVELIRSPDASRFAVQPNQPWYFSEWVPLLVLVLWGVVPVVAGLVVFARTDL